MPVHSHEEAHLFFCLGGAIQHDHSRNSHIVSSSMLGFVPAGVPHADQFHNSVRTFDIVLKPHWLERLRQYGPLADCPMESHGGPPAWLMTRLYREFRQRDGVTPLVLEGLTLELMAQLSRFTPRSAESSLPRWLAQVVDFLHAHFTENVSLESVAAVAGVHPDHLTRAFRQRYRVTVGEYVRRLRVEYACHLLSVSDTPLSQVALEAGFADQSHFHRQFKAQTGATPAEFRRTVRGVGSRHTMLS